MPKAAKPKVTLTDTRLKGLKATGVRYELRDALVPGLHIRVSEKGARTFVLKTRYPGSVHATARALGEYPVIGLEDAREKAREWRKLIGRGIDPQVVAERERQENLQRLGTTFGAVADDFIRDKLAGERRGKEAERELRREFVDRWKDRPITEITDLDVVGVIRAKKRSASTAARNLLALAKRFFRWAKAQRVYGLKASPVDGLTAKDFDLETRRRDRTLGDDELFAFWRAAERLHYPAGPCYRLLALAALRLNEANRGQKPEVDRRDGIWTIPAERMKGRNKGKGQARAHAVPLTGEILGIFDELPKQGGRHFFSTTAGAKPAWLGDKIKKDLDRRMLRTLKALARVRGKDPAAVELEAWVNHDLRRTVRTRLSRLKVSEEAREAVLAHVRPGIKGTYDTHEYLDEKREALTLWAGELRRIVWAPYRELAA